MSSSIGVMLAERVGFEPTNEGTPSPAFEAGAFNRSATSPFGPDTRKELLQDSLSVIAQQTRNHLRSISKDGPRKHIAIAAYCSIVEIVRREHHSLHSRKCYCGSAHWTRLKSNIQNTSVQPPVLQTLSAGSQRKHFGMRRRVVRLFSHIVCGSEQFTSPRNNTPHRDLSLIKSTPGLIKSKEHAVNIGKSHVRTGAPDRNRTCNLRFRRPSLYPVELRAHNDDCIPFPPVGKKNSEDCRATWQ